MELPQRGMRACDFKNEWWQVLAQEGKVALILLYRRADLRNEGQTKGQGTRRGRAEHLIIVGM